MSYQSFWGAIVEQAAMDLLHPEQSGATAADRDNAFSWVKSDSTAPAGYLWACDVAGINPDILRERLRRRGWL